MTGDPPPVLPATPSRAPTYARSGSGRPRGRHDLRKVLDDPELFVAGEHGTERVRVSGRGATFVVWSPDYDKGKAWVPLDDGTDAIVGGSRIER